MDPIRRDRLVDTAGVRAWCTVEGAGPWVTLSLALALALACDASMWGAALAERLRLAARSARASDG